MFFPQMQSQFLVPPELDVQLPCPSPGEKPDTADDAFGAPRPDTDPRGEAGAAKVGGVHLENMEQTVPCQRCKTAIC